MLWRKTRAVLLLALLTTACGPRVASSANGRREIVVFAASSLTDVLGEVKTTWEQRTPDVKVTINFGASSILRTQLEQGARADLFITADEQQMALAASHTLLAGPARTVASNRLVLIVPAKNPGRIAEVRDLARPGVRLVTTSDDVPIGHYTRTALASMDQSPEYGADFSSRVLANVVTQETNVRAVVAKIQLGEGDAAIVYSSDVTAGVREQLRVIAIPDQFNVVAKYPAALLAGSKHSADARALLGYLESTDGQATFQRFGFLPASEPAPARPTASP